MVSAGHDDGGERTKHRARKRRDDDVGNGRGEVATVFIRGRHDRRTVGDALEHVVDPARELGQRQRLDAVAERRPTRGRERRVSWTTSSHAGSWRRAVAAIASSVAVASA